MTRPARKRTPGGVLPATIPERFSSDVDALLGSDPTIDNPPEPYAATKPPASERRCNAIAEQDVAGHGVVYTHACRLKPGHVGNHRCQEHLCCSWANAPSPAPPEQPARDGVRREEFKSIFGAIAFLNGLPLPLLAGHGVRIVVDVEVLDDAPGKVGAK